MKYPDTIKTNTIIRILGIHDVDTNVRYLVAKTSFPGIMDSDLIKLLGVEPSHLAMVKKRVASKGWLEAPTVEERVRDYGYPNVYAHPFKKLFQGGWATLLDPTLQECRDFWLYYQSNMSRGKYNPIIKGQEPIVRMHIPLAILNDNPPKESDKYSHGKHLGHCIRNITTKDVQAFLESPRYQRLVDCLAIWPTTHKTINDLLGEPNAY